jgi:hypothetical protein
MKSLWEHADLDIEVSGTAASDFESGGVGKVLKNSRIGMRLKYKW